VELTNSIGLAMERGIIAAETREAALAALDDDFPQGGYMQAK